jgi:hypothetical protein
VTRRRKSKRGNDWQPEEVLAGKVVIGAHELAELIQRVNPTDRGLPLAEVARRYRLKNQLQSLLVRRFAAEVEVSADREGVALLAHRGSGKSACHAVLAELDEDARSWVQRRLDEDAAPEPATAPGDARVRAPVRETGPVSGNEGGAGPEPLGESDALPDEDLSAEELLARGHEAMEAYDYELAQRAFARALASSRGGAAAAEALLGLLVEHLAAYSEAAALWPRLSPEAAADARIRTLAALAAAHVGDESRAHELLQGLTRESDLAAAAEVYQVLARRSLERDDEPGDAEAAHELALARQHGGPSLALLELERELAAQVARRCAPLEARAAEAYDAGRMDEAEQRARDVLARWPESRAARALLGRIEAQRRQARADALLARADAAMTARDFAVAIGLLREARSLDVAPEGTRAEIAARLAQAEAAARDQAAQARVFEVVTLFAQDRPEQGLLTYLGLDEAQRAEVRRTHGAAMLGWLEDMGAPPSGSRAQAAVQAVLALARACAALARDDGHAAATEIAAHEKMLRQVPATRAVQKDVGQAIERSERARAQDALVRAAALLDAGGDPAPVRALVDGVDPRWLAEPARADLEALRPRLAHAESLAAIEARIARALARGDALDARDAAGAGMAQALPGERADWQRRRDDLNARLRRAWCIQVCPGDGRRPMLDRLGLEPYGLGRSAAVTADGARLVLATSQRRWLFLRVLSTRDMSVEQYVLLRTPAAMQLDTVTVYDGEITLIGKRGKILRLTSDTWDVIAWRDLAAFMGEREFISTAQLMPGTPFLWLSISGAGGMNVMIIDLVRWCVHRTMVGGGLPKRVGATGLMLVDGTGVPSGLYDASGELDPGHRLPEHRMPFDAAAFHPGAPGLILIDKVYRDDESWTRARWVSPQGEDLAVLELARVVGHGYTFLGSDRDRGLMFLVSPRDFLERDLVALVVVGELRAQYRVPLPGHVGLLRDVEGGHRFALDDNGTGLVLVPIGADPPRLAKSGTVPWQILERNHEYPCSALTPAADPHLLAFRAQYREMGADDARKALRALRSNPATDARVWADIVATLAGTRTREVSDEFVAWALGRYPDHAELALNAAQYRVNAWAWAEVPALLGAVDTARLARRRIRHLYHLWGLALYETGRRDEALAVFMQGTAHAEGEEGACELQPYIEMLAPMDLDRDQGRFTTSAGRLRWSVMAARRCLGSGDAGGALAAVDRAPVWRSGDIQSMAHLVEVYLQSEVHGPVDMFHKLLALAAFDACSKPDHEHYLHNRLALPDATWSEAELAALAERVRAWLDEHARRVEAEAARPPD